MRCCVVVGESNLPTGQWRSRHHRIHSYPGYSIAVFLRDRVSQALRTGCCAPCTADGKSYLYRTGVDGTVLKGTTGFIMKQRVCDTFINYSATSMGLSQFSSNLTFIKRTRTMVHRGGDQHTSRDEPRYLHCSSRVW